MTHFFFDLNINSTIQHDYKGRWLPSLMQAQQEAELMAIDLGCTRMNTSAMEVQIRTASGTLLCSVPVQMMDALVA
jgi:hypothetical protein